MVQQLGSGGNGIKKIFATSLSATFSDDREGVGTIRREGNKTYKYIKYDSGSGLVAAVVGNVAYYKAVTGYGLSEVTSDISDADAAVVSAGVLQSVIADGEYGWIQIGGEATLTPALAGGADGQALTGTGATDGTLDVSALVTDHICAVAQDASAKTIICMFPK